jgi:hypothetical protein
MPQASALATARFKCFAFGNRALRFIRLVLEKFARVGNPAEQVIGDQLLARTGRILERTWPMAEQAMPAGDFNYLSTGAGCNLSSGLRDSVKFSECAGPLEPAG